MHESGFRLTKDQEYLALTSLAWLLRVLPRSLALGAGAALGQVGWWLRIRRRLVLGNLAQALPDLSPREHRRIAARSARNFGRTGVEFMRFVGRDRDRLHELVALDGDGELAGALGEGQGAIVVTAHLGAWALYVTALAAAGIPTALLVGRQRNEKVDKFIHSIPGEAVTFISKSRSSPRQVLRSLRKGHAVVMVADQHSGRRGIVAPFLGRETSTMPLPGALVSRYPVPLFSMKGHRRTDGRHQVALRRLETPTGSCESCVRREVATVCNQAIAEAILEHPDQYFWYHRRWRDSDTDLDVSRRADPAEPRAGSTCEVCGST